MIEYVDACYFCTTPYQIIGAISLVKEKNESADLYIIGQFSTFNEIAKRIEKTNIFRKVIAIDENEVLGPIKNINNKIVKRLLMAKQYLKVNKIGDKIIGKDVLYNKMYSTCQAFIIRLMHFYLMEHHPNIEFIHFDDGVGSYYNTYLFHVSFLDKVIRMILFGKKSIDYKSERILYMPQLCNKEQKRLSSSISKMPNINKSKTNINRLNFIFDFQKEDLINEKIIIFDTLKEEVYGSDGAILLQNYYKMICSYFGNDNVIIKNHPRDKNTREDTMKYYNNYAIPSEVLYLNLDVEKKILITVNSTAVVTPKLIMDKEPIIILLYKIMNKNSTNDANQDVFFHNFKKTYRDKNKFQIPENKNELINILDKIKSIS